MISENQQKTVFITSHKLYKFIIMPFSLINMLVTFQRLMNKIFKKQIEKYVAIYLDNINHLINYI